MELDAPLHEEISKLDFLLEELKKWERHGRISSRLRSRLEGEYRRRRRDIVGTLTSRLLQVIEEDKGPREGRVPSIT